MSPKTSLKDQNCRMTVQICKLKWH